MPCDPSLVRDQALEVARGWSGPDAPAGWALTAALFRGLAGDDDLLALAAVLPPDRIPALLFVAALHRVVADHRDHPFAGHFPTVDRDAARPVGPSFAAELHRFCLDHADDLAAAWAGRTYQMNEVARCTQVALALAEMGRRHPGIEPTLVDVGTGAGFGLFPDRYRYDVGGTGFGPADSPVQVACEPEGPGRPAAWAVPPVRRRIGIDVHPVDLGDAGHRDWLLACLPPERGALRRAHAAMELVAAERPDLRSGTAGDQLPAVLDDLPAGEPVCVVDAYTAVFLDDEELGAVQAALTRSSADRPTSWISLDPLVPMGADPVRTVTGTETPDLAVEARRGGVFGVLSLTAVDGGRRASEVLATAHPSGTRMRWRASPS